MPHTPSQRTTRSGSNASSLNLNDVKTLIENSQAEIVKSLKKEMALHGEMLQTLLSKIDDLTKQNERLALRVADLENRVETLSSNQREENEKCFTSMFEDAYSEMEERHKRRKFLVISGLPEPCVGSVEQRRLEDQQAIESLAEAIGVEDVNFENISRIGAINSHKPRLLRLKCSSIRAKISLLRASKNLKRLSKYRMVFINPDLTRHERERDKILRTELRDRRQAGEKVMIRSGRVVNVDWSPSERAQRQTNFV